MRSGQGFGSPFHLANRFFGSLAPMGPAAASQTWAESNLLPSEVELFNSMSGADRRHAIAVARRAELLLDKRHNTHPGRDFVAAALLHDIGKLGARLGTFGRVFGTLLALALGRERIVAWAREDQAPDEGSLKARFGAYLIHDRVGAALLQQAGSGDLTVRWAREHHMPEERWTVDRGLGRILKEADGD